MKDKKDCSNCKHKHKLGYESPCSECCLSIGKGKKLKWERELNFTHKET